MNNPGNTGHRYKMRLIVAVEARDGVVVSRLECGHETCYTPLHQAAEKLARDFADHIGWKERCYQCGKDEKASKSV